MKMSHEEKLSAARFLVGENYPYFSQVSLALIPRISESAVDHAGHPTIGVTDDWVLVMHPAVLDRWTPGGLAGVLIHEIQHCIRDHSDRRIAGSYDPVIWNIAADFEENDDLAAMFKRHKGQAGDHVIRFPDYVGPPRPGVAHNLHAVFPSDRGFPDGLTAEAYYQLLLKAGDKPSQGDQCCGGASGHKLPGEGDPKGGHQGKVGRTPAEQASIRRGTAEAVKAYNGKHPGTVPGGLLRWAEESLRPPTIPWEKKLGRLCRGALTYVQGMVDYTYTKANRRSWSRATAGARVILPSMWAPVPEVAVVVDTSGSMGAPELQAAVSETRGVMKAAGARISFMAVDAAVNSLAEITDWRRIKDLLKGGGGTDFCPIFEALPKLRRRPNVVIIFTDGFGPAPESPPKNAKVIWVLVGEHTRVPAPWGDVVEVPPIQEEVVPAAKPATGRKKKAA